MPDAPAPRPDPGSPGRFGSPGRRGTWRSWVLPGVLAVLLVALGATAVVLVRDRPTAQAAAADLAPAGRGSSAPGAGLAEQAVARARLAARSYFTLAAGSVREDLARFRELATPEFAEEHDEMTAALARRVTTQRLRLSAVLPTDGVATEYLTAARAQLLVSVDVTTRRPATATSGRSVSTASSYRTRVVLEWLDDEWRVAALDEVA